MTNSNVELKKFGGAHALESQVASDIAAQLAGAIGARGQAGLLVSGGHSPAGLFQQLGKQTIDWSRVSIALVDERWVEPTDPAAMSGWYARRYCATARPRRASWD